MRGEEMAGNLVSQFITLGEILLHGYIIFVKNFAPSSINFVIHVFLEINRL